MRKNGMIVLFLAVILILALPLPAQLLRNSFTSGSALNLGTVVKSVSPGTRVIDACGASDVPVGIITLVSGTQYEVSSSGVAYNVHIATGSATVEAGDYVVTATGGSVKKDDGTGYVVGTALSAGSAGGNIQVFINIQTRGGYLASAGGDLNGSFPNPVVEGIQGKPVSTDSPTDGEALRWNGSEWTPTPDSSVFSISSSANTTGRTGHMRIVSHGGSTITESASDDTIYVSFGSTGSGTTTDDTCTVAPPAPPYVDGATDVCSGEPGAGYSVFPDRRARYYHWTVPTGSIITDGIGSNSILVIFGSMDGNVCASAVNECGSSSSTCMAVSINRPTSPGVVTGDARVCESVTGKVYAIVSVPDASNYLWTVPAGASITAGSGTPTITVAFGTTSGEVCVRTENSCGISEPSCLAIDVTHTPDTPGAITGSAAMCGGTTGLTYSVTDDPIVDTYNWTVPSGASITDGAGTNSITVTMGTASGNVSVTAQNICGTSSARTLAVTVTNPPATPGTITGNSIVLPGATGEPYSISAVSGASSYTWNGGVGATVASGGTTTNATFNFTGSAGSTTNICVTASNSCGTSSSQCKTVTIGAPPGSVTYNYTGSSQSWTVPAGVVSVTVDASGAQGYSGSGGIPGKGGRVQSTLTVTPGELLYIYVGQAGTGCSSGGWNGGAGTSCNYSYSGTGGGATDIRRGGTALGNRILVAGGGGGAGYNWGSTPSDDGGAGGGTTGGRNASCPVTGAPGYGGTQTGGGAGGAYSGYSSGNPGSLGNGGTGASGTGGGGGGGGYYGGGGGSWGGGGGGSSYSIGSGTVHTQGYRSGNGTITISW